MPAGGATAPTAAARITDGVTVAGVKIGLPPGSVVCNAVVDVPNGYPATFIQSSLARHKDLLIEHLTKTESKMPGIQTVLTGGVKAEETMPPIVAAEQVILIIKMKSLSYANLVKTPC